MNNLDLLGNENNVESSGYKADICPECKKGILIPLNPDYPPQKNHCFVCDNCGSMRMINPSITIE